MVFLHEIRDRILIMAYNEKLNRCDANNCVEHRWPKSGGMTHLGIGKTEMMRCNNCCAVKVIYSADFFENGQWIEKHDEKIIEPDWKTK